MPPKETPRTEFLQIRLSPEDRERLRRIAEAEHLDLSTWARRVLLQTAERFEPTKEVPRRRVAEGPPPHDRGDSTRDRRRK
jgi:hypothetical protein